MNMNEYMIDLFILWVDFRDFRDSMILFPVYVL